MTISLLQLKRKAYLLWKNASDAAIMQELQEGGPSAMMKQAINLSGVASYMGLQKLDLARPQAAYTMIDFRLSHGPRWWDKQGPQAFLGLDIPLKITSPHSQ